jgi:hypothetical protein
MTYLYELRTYVAQAGRLPILTGKWESHHHAIYADFHTLLAGFVSRVGPSEPDGVALLLRHDDRRAVDSSLAALIASNRMNEVPGPPGPTVVDHWERTFLYPLSVSELQ